MSLSDRGNDLICPFLTVHVGSGGKFTSTCSSISKNCIYSENGWDGGVIFFKCLKEKCVFWNSDTQDCALFSIFTYIKHFHDSHSHSTKHPVTEVPADMGAYFHGIPDATKLASEWLNQEDLDGDGSTYGPTPTCGNPVLEALKSHPCWPGYDNTVDFEDINYEEEVFCAAVKSLSASSGDYYNKIKLAWPKSTNATSYNIYRSTSSNSTNATLISNVDNLTTDDIVIYYDENVNCCSYNCSDNYYYWIQSICNGTVAYSLSPAAGGYCMKIPAIKMIIDDNDKDFSVFINNDNNKKSSFLNIINNNAITSQTIGEETTGKINSKEDLIKDTLNLVDDPLYPITIINESSKYTSDNDTWISDLEKYNNYKLLYNFDSILFATPVGGVHAYNGSIEIPWKLTGSSDSPVNIINIDKEGNSDTFRSNMNNLLNSTPKGSNPILYIAVDNSGSMQYSDIEEELNAFTNTFDSDWIIVIDKINTPKNERWLKWLTDFIDCYYN